MRKVSGRRDAPLRGQGLLGAVLDDLAMQEKAAGRGGELLLIEGRGCRRVGRIAALPVPGRDRATREPWRMAAAALFMLGETAVPRRLRSKPVAALSTALRCGLDCPFTSSASCLIDAAAGLLGVDSRAALEDLAKRHGREQPLAWSYCLSADGELDFLPLLEDLAAVEDVGLGAALFLSTLADGLAEWVLRASRAHGVGRAALCGDCLDSPTLAHGLRSRFDQAGVETFAASDCASLALAGTTLASSAISETSST